MMDGAWNTALAAENIEMVLGSGPHRVQVLRGVSLSLDIGEIALLMGPSGSGKSTLLSILGCILKPTRGEVTVANVPCRSLDSDALVRLRRKHVGFVFQTYNLFPGLTARENVQASLAIHGVSERASRQPAERALQSLGLGHRIRALPGELSGGEQQRVAIARAIVGNPSIILADEPTAALDTEAGRSVLQQLRRLAKEEQRAVLVVTHDDRALPFADRILRIEDGQIWHARPPQGPKPMSC